MYFYSICAAGYEDSFKTTYCSSQKYSQEEFEQIVVESYKQSCKDFMDEDERNVCFDLDFKISSRIWDYEKNFDRIMEEKYGLIPMYKVLSANVGFDLTHYGKEDPMNQRIYEALNEIDVDESCWDNECSRLPKKERSNWYRQNCLIYRRKQARIKNRSCDNCAEKPYHSSSCNGELCDRWCWDGDGTIKKYD